MAPVTIRFGDDARRAMMAGIDRLADTVSVTLGPGGRTVLIDRPGATPRITKDGVSVADALEEEGRYEQLGLRIARRAAQRVGEDIGDGTTTAVVLTREIAAGAMTAVAAGCDPLGLRRALEAETREIVAELRRRAVPLGGRADIARIAAISANGDGTLGGIVAEAFDAVGADGIVTVEAGQSFETTWERMSGMRWEGGYVSPYFMTDAATTECRYENPLILLTDAKLENRTPLLKVLEAAVRAQRPLLIVAEAVTGEALQTLVTNKVRNGLKVVAGKAPLFGDRRLAWLEDIAVVTGGRVMSEARGDDIARISEDALGSADRIVLAKDATTIIGGGGSADEIAARADSIRAQQGLDGNTPFHEKFLAERYARLTGGIAVVRVGGISETEIGERRDRADDAASAVRAAATDGILPGGGAAYIHAGSAVLNDKKTDTESRAARVVLGRALAAPASRIAANAGFDGRAVAARIAADDDPLSGFDARSGRHGDLVSAGVIDPAAVAIAALETAVSVAALLMSAETVIAKPPPPPRPTRADDIPFGPEAKDMTAEEAGEFGLV